VYLNENMQLEYEFARRTAVPARTRFKNLKNSKPKLVSIIFKNSIYYTKKYSTSPLQKSTS
jgi:hypothetical protein